MASYGFPGALRGSSLVSHTYSRVCRALAESPLKTRSGRPTKSASYRVRRKSVNIWTSRGVF